MLEVLARAACACQAMPCHALSVLAGGSKPRWVKQLPEVAHYLGWCTWDAFYHDVSAQGIAAGLNSFKQAGVLPRWIIIDDGWQVGLFSVSVSW